MRTIIAGGREVTDPKVLEAALKEYSGHITTVICGGAKGADELGRQWGKANNIPVEEFAASWSTYGRKAGFMRNLQMAENAEALVALWNGESKGTANMITVAKARKLKVFVYLVGD